MKALVVNGKGGVEVDELPEPSPAPDSVVIAVHSCGVCGSDVHGSSSGWFQPGHVMGHEVSGTIVAIGREVENLNEGDRVTVNPLGGCGTCLACRRNMPFACTAFPNIGISAQGGYAEKLAVRAAQIRRLPVDMAIEDGAHVEPLAVALNAIKLAQVAPGESAFVFGVGAIGLNVIIGLRAAGASRIVAVGRSAARRGAAKTLGADLVVDSRDSGYGETITSMAGTFDHAFECAGASQSVPTCLELLGSGGTLVQLALPSEPTSIDLRSVVSLGVRIFGSCAFGVDGFNDSLSLVASKPSEVAELVTDRVPLEGAPEAFDRLLNDPGQTVGVLVQPWRDAAGGEQ